ncbi:6530_t:CDS:2, partial [Funneliformis caledonium]
VIATIYDRGLFKSDFVVIHIFLAMYHEQRRIYHQIGMIINQ